MQVRRDDIIKWILRRLLGTVGDLVEKDSKDETANLILFNGEAFCRHLEPVNG